MNIDNQFENLKAWAETRGILLIEGDFEQHKSPLVDIPNSDEDSLSTFQMIIEKLETKVIICDTLKFDKEKFEIYEATIDKLNDEIIKEKFEGIRHYKDKFLGYALMIFNQGMTFRFSKYIGELDDYLEIESAALDHIEENNGEHSKFKDIPQEKVIEFSRQLAEHENYIKLKNRTQRENFATELFNDQLEQLSVHSAYGINIIVSSAEIYFETKIKPQREKELKLNITELLNKGWTKVKIAAHLNISKDTLNKYV